MRPSRSGRSPRAERLSREAGEEDARAGCRNADGRRSAPTPTGNERRRGHPVEPAYRHPRAGEIRAGGGVPRHPHLRPLALLLALSLSACTPPERALLTECIAPANAGGGWDLTCRLTGQILADLGLVSGAVPTLNIPGAGGGVAFAHAVGQRSTDERVFFAASPATTLRLAQEQYGRLRTDDVRWIGALGAEYGIVAVAADAPWSGLADLMEEWARRPEEIVVSGGSAVVGQDHMKMLLLGREAGIDPRRIRYVPFDGGGEALTALLGGFVHVFSGEASEIEGHLEAGSVRVLAILAPERVGGILARVPTATEAGYGVTWVTWRGYYVPGGVSEDAYAEWVRRLRVVARSEAWEAARARARLRPFVMLGREFESFVMAQVEEFRGLAREIGIVE